MVNDPAALLRRLDAIGASLARHDDALALIGLGSVGLELTRLDGYSDLDFFVLVASGARRGYLDDLAWLSDICPIAYAFPNTADGYKLLFADGIFCEFAIFEPAGLAAIPFAPGRVIWKQPQVPERIGTPAQHPAAPTRRDSAWLVGEALTNLYVGLARERRGERLSATRFIQGYAVDRLLELVAEVEPPGAAPADGFAPERRFEQRFPRVAAEVAAWMQGYERNSESARAILAFLEHHFDVNAAMAARVRALCE